MAIKRAYKNLKEIPAEDVRLYVERGGEWVLDAEEDPAAGKVAEFRATNIALMKERDELLRRFEGINPDEVRRLAAEKKRLEEEAQLKAGEFDKVLGTRVQAARSELEKQLATVAGERDTLNRRLVAIQIDQAVLAEGTKRGLRGTAVPDIVARARNTFRLVNGVPQAFEADGQTARMGKDGASPMGLAEWLDTQVAEAPHLFEASTGGGAVGNISGGGVSRSVRNPFRKETWNLTEQMRLQRNDPQLAARLKAAA